jgi:hypothetical protein
MSAPTQDEVWLVAGLGAEKPPPTVPVLDDQLRCWCPGEDGQWHTVDGRHHCTYRELHNRTDLRKAARS